MITITECYKPVPLFHTCSAELAQYLDSHMVPIINQTRNSSTEADSAASERGTNINVYFYVIVEIWQEIEFGGLMVCHHDCQYIPSSSLLFCGYEVITV